MPEITTDMLAELIYALQTALESINREAPDARIFEGRLSDTFRAVLAYHPEPDVAVEMLHILDWMEGKNGA